MKGFCIMWLYDIATQIDSNEWNAHYTCNPSQHSDDGTMCKVAGIREGCIETFTSVKEMDEYCEQNGWTTQVEEEL